MLNASRRQTQLLQSAVDIFPLLLAGLALGQVQLGDELAEPLKRDGFAVVVEILDNLLLILRVTFFHDGLPTGIRALFCRDRTGSPAGVALHRRMGVLHCNYRGRERPSSLYFFLKFVSRLGSITCSCQVPQREQRN